MRRLFAGFLFMVVVVSGCYTGYGGDLPQGHHDQVSQYVWHIIYDDGVVVYEYYSDTQPTVDLSLSGLDVVNAREANSTKLTDTIYDELSFPVDEFSILKVIKQPLRSDSEDLDNFEWRVVFTDASGERAEFYLHHQPEELWPVNSDTRAVKMVRGFVRMRGTTLWVGIFLNTIWQDP
ncbi:MAG: hypothetical protein UU22_C0035G0010 [Parcubacteria group bacterium GW2011_GWA2_40_8]|nr:MAG: hypothetical protein UT82_C0022G0005 [Parcubacteria group bacterium GW2011_GWB1_40_14]KKR77854.1 MAG: hypothetical protein UU22_C0035G0010 [Parcubacteria group bacterium GW2011_GWA2_40_8]